MSSRVTLNVYLLILLLFLPDAIDCIEFVIFESSTGKPKCQSKLTDAPILLDLLLVRHRQFEGDKRELTKDDG